MDNIQPGNVGGNGYDIAILYPPESFIGQFVFGDIMEQLSGERLFYFFNLADVFGRRLQVFVCFGMRRHEVEGQPYRIGAVGSGYVFHETMSDAVVHPIGNVVQAGSVTVDFAPASSGSIARPSLCLKYRGEYKKQATFLPSISYVAGRAWLHSSIA